MKSILLLSALLVAGLGTLTATAQTASTVSNDQYVQNTLYPATVLLFSQNQDGGMKMRCTATSFEKTKDGYRFATAAHCATEDGDQNKKKAKAEVASFYISSDTEGAKDYVPVKIDGCGSRSHGDDFCIFSAKTKREFPLVAIGTDPTKVAGEPIINIAAPLGLGKQTFYGRVSKAHVDRTIIQDDINWTGAMLLQLPGTDGGSSGSAIVCADQSNLWIPGRRYRWRQRGSCHPCLPVQKVQGADRRREVQVVR